MELAEITQAIRDVPDFPKPGVIFKDISPILQDPHLFRGCIELLAAPWKQTEIQSIAAVDARGFIFGSALALHLGCGLTMIRKKGKLPWKTYSVDYDLEYGSASLEIHQDAVTPGQKVLLIDDVLATGGTAAAAVKLLRELGAEVVAAQFVMELTFLDGKQRMGDCPIQSLITV